jgi:glutamine synthetase
MRCWGTENREAALRFIAGTTEANAGSANMEIKPVDGTANAYLAIGAVLAAGIAGIEQDEHLPPSTEEDPLLLSSDEQHARGIDQLPASLTEAAERLAESTVLREAMGEFLFETFLATRRGEAKEYEGLEDDALIRALRWRY